MRVRFFFAAAPVLFATTLASADDASEVVVRTSFTTDASTDTIRGATCGVIGAVTKDGHVHPYDVQLGGTRCATTPASQGALVLRVSTVQRQDDASLRDVIVEMDRPADLTDEEAHTAVTNVSAALRRGIEVKPIVVHVDPKPPIEGRSERATGYAMLGFGGAAMLGGVITGLVALGDAFGCSMSHLFDGGSCPSETALLVASGSLLASGVVLAVAGGVFISIGKRKARLAAFATPTGGGMRVVF
jgi:hypothetical protein